MEERTCKHCGGTFPLNREHFGSTPSGGFRHKCRACVRQHVWQYDNANEERKRAAVARAQRRSHLGWTDGERESLKRSLARRDGAKCFYCGVLLIGNCHIDHKTPVVKGGTNTLGNLVLACVQCNQEKHNKTVSEYRVWRSKNGLSSGF
jgi:5-methylcytosine-specific restriction endonuclease McrA